MTWKRAVVLTVTLVLIAAAAGWPVYVHPKRDSASAADPADVALALGGLAYTAQFAQQLQARGEAREVLISNPYGSNPYGARQPLVDQLCTEPHVTCFVPDPSTTRGEAEELARLATANGWDDVIVVAPTWHISRARLIVKRCYTGRLRMVDPGVTAFKRDWPLQYVYQTAGFIKAAIVRGC